MSDRQTPAGTEPSFLDICEEVVAIFTGLVAALLPFILLSAPALIPLAVFGGVVLAAHGLVLGVLAAVAAVPVLLVRMLVRRTRRRPDPYPSPPVREVSTP